MEREKKLRMAFKVSATGEAMASHGLLTLE